MEDLPDTWRSQLPPHVHHAYTTAGCTTQVPVRIHLLRLIQYPQADILERELTNGFQLMGDLQPGTNWYVRTDQKYLHPRSPQDFIDHNHQYMQQKLLKPRVDDPYAFMLEEIVQEVRAGRMNGPFRQPPSWPTSTITPSGYDMDLPLPHPTPKIAMAFSIKQTGSDGKDEIRRGEDWRRSGHNSTCTMHDQPFHHAPDHFASLVIQTHQLHPKEDMHVWGHDHDGAYRQLPWTICPLARAPHCGATTSCYFGSCASVWGYNRFGDAMVSVSRILLLCPTMQYVDDYGSTEITRHSASRHTRYRVSTLASNSNMSSSHLALSVLTGCARTSSVAYKTTTLTQTWQEGWQVSATSSPAGCLAKSVVPHSRPFTPEHITITLRWTNPPRLLCMLSWTSFRVASP